MKRGALHIFGRKKNSLFDTNVKMKDMDASDMELVLASSVIPDAGTASVRARPTVKHHNASFDSFQGLNVPTPKVPLLPPSNGPKINGSAGGDWLSNGSIISGPDIPEEEAFVPPHPSVAPPAPPGTSDLPLGAFIPPPDFMGDLSTLDPATLQPLSLPAAANPSALAPSREEGDFNFLKPPPMAPPKAPSTCSSSSASSVPISNPPYVQVPDHPKFAPPQPPTEKPNKTFKTPPQKPIRLSSISNIDPTTNASASPVQSPTLSTFNPQQKAKLYNVPTTSVLKGHEELDTKPKQRLLLEDSEAFKTVPALVQVDGKAPEVASPIKPVSKNLQELKDSLQISQPPPSPLPVPNKEAKQATVPAPQIEKPLPNIPQISPQFKKNSLPVITEPKKGEFKVTPHGSPKYSPLLERKLRNLRSSETNAPRDGQAASPLALLMAAKKRKTKNKSVSENSAKKDDEPSDSGPNSLINTPRSSSPASLLSQERVQEVLKSGSPVDHAQTIQTSEKSSSPPSVKNQSPGRSLGLSRVSGSPSVTDLLAQTENSDRSLSNAQSPPLEDLGVPFIPPPPEFDDFDDIVGPPPSIPPPDPPQKVTPFTRPTQTPPPPPPPPPSLPQFKLPSLPSPPKLPPPITNAKPILKVPAKPKAASDQIPPNLSPSQVTLLSILQKKMVEMDQRMAPTREAESNADDWGSPLSDEESKEPIVPKAKPQSKSTPVGNKPATLDLRELQGKVAGNFKGTSSVKVLPATAFRPNISTASPTPSGRAPKTPSPSAVRGSLNQDGHCTGSSLEFLILGVDAL